MRDRVRVNSQEREAEYDADATMSSIRSGGTTTAAQRLRNYRKNPKDAVIRSR